MLQSYKTEEIMKLRLLNLNLLKCPERCNEWNELRTKCNKLEQNSQMDKLTIDTLSRELAELRQKQQQIDLDIEYVQV